MTSLDQSIMVHLLSWALCHLHETDVLLSGRGKMAPRQAIVGICQNITECQQGGTHDPFHTLNLRIMPLASAWQELEGTFSPSG